MLRELYVTLCYAYFNVIYAILCQVTLCYAYFSVNYATLRSFRY
jgi:hypothetical protein